MKVSGLFPQPMLKEPFMRRRERFVPSKPGCYVLANYNEEVMYVGLTKNLRSRFNQHLDSEEKTAVTELGRAMLFFWLETENIEKMERTWMNIHAEIEGRLPVLNKVYSPTST